MSYLLFDIGGTQTRLAISKDGLSFEEPVVINTPQNFDQAVEEISSKAKEMADGEIKKAVGGIAGSLMRDKTGVYRSGNLLDWEQKNLKLTLQEKLDCDLFLENDTALVGLGESVVGAGKRFSNVMYVTFSTGVNAVRVIDDKLDIGVFAPEVGDQVIDVFTHLDDTTNFGDFESFVSGREIEKQYGVKPEELNNEQEWRKIAQFAAIGIFNSIVHWSPEAVVLGGSLMKKIPQELIYNKLNMMLSEVYPESPEVLKAELGNIGGLYGALHYLQTQTGIDVTDSSVDVG